MRCVRCVRRRQRRRHRRAGCRTSHLVPTSSATAAASTTSSTATATAAAAVTSPAEDQQCRDQPVQGQGLLGQFWKRRRRHATCAALRRLSPVPQACEAKHTPQRVHDLGALGAAVSDTAAHTGGRGGGGRCKRLERVLDRLFDGLLGRLRTEASSTASHREPGAKAASGGQLSPHAAMPAAAAAAAAVTLHPAELAEQWRQRRQHQSCTEPGGPRGGMPSVAAAAAAEGWVSARAGQQPLERAAEGGAQLHALCAGAHAQQRARLHCDGLKQGVAQLVLVICAEAMVAAVRLLRLLRLLMLLLLLLLRLLLLLLLLRLLLPTGSCSEGRGSYVGRAATQLAGVADKDDAGMGELGELGELHLNDNQLSGAIPAELGQLGALSRLYLHNNQLSGPVPAELGQLGELTALYLDNNQLTGQEAFREYMQEHNPDCELGL
jgi:hypothetical protein